MVQWLGTFTVVVLGSTLDQGTKMPQATWHDQTNNRTKKKAKINKMVSFMLCDLYFN